MKILNKINESILLSILLPIVAISAIVTVIAVSLLIKSFESFQRAQVEADLTLAAQLAVGIAEGGLHDLLALRLEKDPNSIEAFRNQALEEIKQLSKNFHQINLLVIENQSTILAASQDIPQDQVKLPELRLRKSPVFTADLWGEPLLLHYQYFPLWRWHIISYIQGKDYAALAVFTQRFLYFAVFMGVAIILLAIMAVFHTRVNLPLKSLVRTAATVGQGDFVSMAIKRWDEIGQVKQAFNDMVINLQATQKALKESEATLQSLFRAAPIGIGLLQERVILFVNEQILRTTGYSLDELQGQSSLIFYPSKEEFHRIGEVKYKDIRKFGTGTIETQWRHKKGHLIEVLLSSSFINPDDPGSGTVFTALDITARRRTEEALKYREARYRELVESANSIILRMDAEGVITFFNEFAEHFFGYAKGEILGRNALGAIVPARDSYGRDQQALIQDMRLQPERYANLESEGVKRSGERVWVAWTNRAILDNQGQVTEILCVGSDVTARRLAEMERQKAMAQLQTSLDQSISGIIIADAPDGAIRYANPAALNIRGETDLPLTGIDFSRHSSHWQIYRPEGSPYPTEEVPLSRAVLRGEITRNEELVIVNAKGQKRWVLTNAAPVRNNEGTIISGIVVFHDITERKRADEELSLYKDHLEDLVKERTAALTESEARFRVIFDGASVGIVLRDLNGKVLAINQAYAKMVGYTQEEMVEVGWSFLHPQDAPRYLSQFQELAEGSRDFFFEECRAFHREGHEVWGRERLSRIKGKDGEGWYILGLIEDITAERAMEQEIAAYQERLRALASDLAHIEERERRRLAADLHDHVGQILALTQINLGALKKEVSDHQVLVNLDEIRSQLSRVIRLTRSLNMELSFRALDELGLEAGIQWLGEKFREQYGLDIEVECQDMEGCLDHDRKTLLFRVVRELLINVVKHAQARTVKIFLSENNGEVRLSVGDDGVGLKEDQQTSLDSFGLFSIAERMRNLGGRLDIDSSPGQGVQVSISLPLH